MRHSRAYYVVLVGIGILSICEPYTSTAFLPNPVDAFVNVIWAVVQCAAVFCVGVDAYRVIRRRV